MGESFSTYNLFNTFKDDKVSFVYQGCFINDMVVAAIELVESGLCEKRGLKKLRNKLSFLMIESFQNIIRYGDEPENTNEKYRKELFLVRNVNNYFYIVSANIVENSKINFVKFKLEEVNNLNKKELNKLYQHVLTNNEFTEAGGAGLGFIEMVRKTEENLLYDFDRINEKYSYFYLIIKIRGLDAEKTQVHPISIDWVKNFHINTSKNDVIAIHKGDFLPKVIGPAINIVEKNIKNKLVNVQKLAFYLIHETLQNINQLPSGINDEKKAIFIISKNNSNYFVSTGNYIKDTKASLVKKQLDAMKKLDLKQLKNMYYEIINKRVTLQLEQKFGLGLIDIALESNKLFDYKFTKTTNNISFYSLRVKV